MIRERVLKDLVLLPQFEFPVTSAYFTLDNIAGNRKSHIVEIKKQIRYKKDKTYFKQLTPPEQDSVISDFDRILHWYGEELNPAESIGSICFSASDSDFWRTINFKRPLPQNTLVIQPYPYIRPYTMLFSRYRNYAVILVDRTKARIFESRLGAFKEHFYIEDNAPEPVKVGGFKGRQERKVERNIYQGVIQHYKEVSQTAFDLFQKYKFHWIILGGRKEVLTDFSKYLHTYLSSRIAGQIEIEPGAPLPEVLKKIETTEEKARHDYERILLKNLLDKKSAGQAVDGIQAVLDKIQDNWADTLIIQENYFTKGLFCRNCGYLSLKPLESCPSGCGQLERTNDLVEQLVHRALKQGVDIQFVASDMEKQAGIAASLRFPIGG
ncbi:MAG: hypothetical protein M0P75_04580 [Candidatus Marinimicrobia bacterium]|nr:hypothetical protein [Candidatus Neomarinimicrobiota bacterium]